jgi:hypothetical protein
MISNIFNEVIGHLDWNDILNVSLTNKQFNTFIIDNIQLSFNSVDNVDSMLRLKPKFINNLWEFDNDTIDDYIPKYILDFFAVVKLRRCYIEPGSYNTPYIEIANENYIRWFNHIDKLSLIYNYENNTLPDFRGVSISSLYINWSTCRRVDLSPIAYLKELILVLGKGKIDITNINGLEYLETSFIPEGDLSKLKRIKLINSDIEDISGLKNIQSVSLIMCYLVTDYSPLYNAKYVNLSHSFIHDPSVIKNALYINLTDTEVYDVSMLTNAIYLNVSETSVEDVNMLTNLKCLDISSTRVKDISNLTNLVVLNIYKSLVKDISNLKLLKTIVSDFHINIPIKVEELHIINWEEYINIC